jgi:hypothetical protein
MKYALFEAIKEKSDTTGFRDLKPAVETLLLRYGKPSQPSTHIVLFDLANDTAIFGALLFEADNLRVAYRVHYFQDDPVVFESHPS